MPNRGKRGGGRGGRGGFNKGGRGGRGGGGGGGGGGARQVRWGTNRTDIPKTNEKLESYYNELNIIPEDERDAFWNSLKQDLPNSFRFTGSKGHALTVQKRLVEHYIPEIVKVTYQGEAVEPPKPVEWFPDQLAWAMTTPKNVIRKFPPFASFQKFLVSENSVGNITRQEIVSMIPPLVMDVRPGMTVLDLCAAPGSKSAQLIEMVHGGEEARLRKVLEGIVKKEGGELGKEGMEVDLEMDQAEQEQDYEDDGRATGLLIANDVDYRRAQMLVHQCKRLNSPNLIVTNHDATMFPSIKIPSPPGQPHRYLKFDRILADVPCSGDGTCRKNPEIWKDWAPSKGLGLHVTQVRILVRALQMLKVGGRVVYSTCSMNPIEDEAVVAAAIDRCGGPKKVKLLDTTDMLPGMKRKPGLTTWKVQDRKSRWYNTWADVEKARETTDASDGGMLRLVESMFPSTTTTDEESVPLHNCIRVYPHLQDTGGFFIAVLEKQSEIRARPENEPKKASAETPAGGEHTSIINIVNEIETKDANHDVEGMEHLEALDAVMPGQVDPDNDMDTGNTPAAARQNQANAPSDPVSSRKRAAADAADASAATKRPKVREAADEPVEIGAEDRRVHYPPPPGAELDATEHHHEKTSTSTPASANTPAPNPNQMKRNGQPHEEPFKYLDPAHDELDTIINFYHLSSRFPRDRYMVRNATGQPVKSIYYTSALARDLLTENEGKGLKIVHCGVKMFVKQDTQNSPEACKWRIQSEGLPIVEHWVGPERVVHLHKKETLRRLLKEMFPKLNGENAMDLAEIGDRVKSLGMGCCVLRVEPGAEDDGFEERLVMPLWRGIGSLNLMLPKEERKAMLLRLWNDDSELVDHSRGSEQGHRNGRDDRIPRDDGVDKDDTARSVAEAEDLDGEANTPTNAETPMPNAPSNPKAEHGDFAAPNDADILAKLEADLGHNPDADIDDEDGGVPLSIEQREDQAVRAMEAEDKNIQVEDALKGEAQNLADKTYEEVPGEMHLGSDAFNKTV